jgi:hypothetical protein
MTTFRAAAGALNVAPATAHRWWHRKQAANACGLRAGSWLCDRSSRSYRQPRRLSAAEEGADSASMSRDRAWAWSTRRDCSPRAINDLEGAPPARALTTSTSAPAKHPTLRVVSSWRAASRYPRPSCNASGRARSSRRPTHHAGMGRSSGFFQTLKREWADAHIWTSSTARTQALPSFIRYYNRQRPHSSLADRPPISHVHNLHGHDN